MYGDLNLGAGQLAVSAGALISPVLATDNAERINITCHNTGGSSETVVITVLVAGGTARRVARAVLAANESFLLSGLPINGADIVKGATTNATAVDYNVTKAGEDAPFYFQVFDAGGAVKNAQSNTTYLGSVTSSSPSAGVGYATGAGSAVSQATDRTTGVTINAICGKITTQATSLATAGEVSFTVTNSACAVDDTVIANIRSGPTTLGSTQVSVTTVAAGSFQLTLNNLHASVADTGAAIINFAILKAVAA